MVLSHSRPGRAGLIHLLKDIGYDGTVSIEHEDADYEGTLEAVSEGILRAKEHLEQYI